MASTVARLNEKGVLPLDHKHKWMRSNIHYEVIKGEPCKHDRHYR